MPKPAAQAEPVRRKLTQAEIDAAIQEWNGNIESKHAVVRYMKDHAREKDTAAWLRQEYGDDLPALPVTVDGAAGDVPWPKVQRRIAQLIKEDRFYTQVEQDNLDDVDPIAIREALAERGSDLHLHLLRRGLPEEGQHQQIPLSISRHYIWEEPHRLLSTP